MRIVQISDIHWRGSQRHDEYTRAFSLLFEKIKELKPDIIVNTGDIFHTKTASITPEVIGKLAWMFRELGDICPTYTMLGNHDGNLTNLEREDAITPIHNAVAHPNNHLMKSSGVYPVQEGINLCVFSPFDKKAWSTTRPQKGCINIALYHGSISGCYTDTDFQMAHGEAEVQFFDGFDFVLMGDIHKQQWIAHRPDYSGKQKPYIAYPGSLIQQNHGETEEKGFLVWDIEDENKWNVEFHSLENFCPFYTVPWQGNVEATLRHIVQERGPRAFLPGSRARVRTHTSLSKLEHTNIIHELRKRGVGEATVKYELSSNTDNIDTKNISFSKKKLSSDPDLIIKLFNEFVSANKKVYPLNKKQLENASKAIRKYISQLHADKQSLTEVSNWTIKYLEFDNLFRYGEGNFIDFKNMDGLVGLFGRNRLGKSSVVGSIMYALFNTTDRGSMKSAYIINKNKNRCWAKVRIGVGPHDWIIERETERIVPKKRERNPDDSKTATKVNLWKVFIDENGEEVLENQNCDSRDDTDKKIRKLLGSAEDFMLTAFAGQGDVNRFLEQGATQRKQALSRILELDIFDKLYAYAREEYTLLNNRGKLLQENDWSEKAVATEKEIEEIQKNIVLTDNDLKKVSAEVSRLASEIAKYNETHSDENPKKLAQLQNALDIDSAKIKENKSKILSLKNSLATLHEEKNTLSNQGTEIDLEKLSSQLKKQKELEMDLSKISANLTLQENMLNNQIKSIKKLDTVPCGDSFPECKFIKDSHEDKKNYGLQKELVENLRNQNANLKSMLDSFVKQNIEKKISDFNKAKVRLEKVSSEILQSTNVIEKLEFENEKLNFGLGDKTKQASLLKEAIDFFKNDKHAENVSHHRSESLKLKNLENSKNKLYQVLGAKELECKNFKEKKEQTKQLLEELKVFDSIQGAFNKMGIPAMVLEHQMPLINNEIKKILEGIVDFNITLHTDSNSNVMDVYIEDTHSKRIIELASGMEKSMCSLAIRAALVNLSSLTRPDIFILDESYGALDPDSLQSAIQLLSSLKNSFRTILTISHISEIKECADIMLEVEDMGIESKICWPNQ